jgi:hypothetical protein
MHLAAIVPEPRCTHRNPPVCVVSLSDVRLVVQEQERRDFPLNCLKGYAP